MASVAIMSIIMMVVGLVLSITYRSTTDMGLSTTAQDDISQAMRDMELKMMHMNEILSAATTGLTYVADIETYPDYDEEADYDLDGKLNYEDPDLDNDATKYATTSTMAWSVGYNLKDDDDDDDGNIDMRWKFYAEDGRLKYDYSYNEEAWGSHVKVLLEHITFIEFTYFGSTEELLSIGGLSIDTDGDRTVTSEEMDDSAMYGNSNGRLDSEVIDTEGELDYIVSVKVFLRVDVNEDGKIDFETGTGIMPPLLYLKRKP